MPFSARGGNHTTIIGDACVKESSEENLLGITFDQSLSFKEHVKTLCRKASQKLHALARVSCYMVTVKLQHLMRAFVISHFSYCPLVWMFYERTMNNRINHVHEWALRIAYKDHRNEFGYLLDWFHNLCMLLRADLSLIQRLVAKQCLKSD